MTTILMILFAPDVYMWLLMAAMGLLTLTIFLLCRRTRRRWIRLLALLFVLAGWYVLLYGTFVGVNQLRVRHVEYASPDLPPSFDGYRIVQFGDAHVGTLTGWRRPLLERAVDSILAQHPDLIVFTGDMQNKVPEEVEPFVPILSKLKAPDGICSVLGNHDYPEYVDANDFEKDCALGKAMLIQQDMEWNVLSNGWHRIRRGQESIVIAGMENDGEGRFLQLGNIHSALIGLSRQTYVVMLEHDPSSWRRRILPHSHCQLTLSGHTHGGQFSLFGWSLASLRYREYSGMYYVGDRAMFVTGGLSGVVPFRFGTPPEIVVITLKKK